MPLRSIFYVYLLNLPPSPEKKLTSFGFSLKLIDSPARIGYFQPRSFYFHHQTWHGVLHYKNIHIRAVILLWELEK